MHMKFSHNPKTSVKQ